MSSKDADRLQQFAILFQNMDEEVPAPGDLPLQRFFRGNGRPIVSVEELDEQYPYYDEQYFIQTQYDRFSFGVKRDNFPAQPAGD